MALSQFHPSGRRNGVSGNTCASPRSFEASICDRSIPFNSLSGTISFLKTKGADSKANHAAHQQTLRRHYLNLRRGETPDRPMEHDLHCFDSLRQSVMCQANDELLYTTGHNDAGINQTRMCRDWDALREWATGFTSCYHDYVAPPGETKWGKCDNGMDGLPYGSLLS
jgi:Domain of unknown function (DUF3328).